MIVFSKKEVALLVIAIIAVAILSLYTGMTLVSQFECEALGFEYGIYVLHPDPHTECEYQLRVPLREVLPPIGGGHE